MILALLKAKTFSHFIMSTPNSQVPQEIKGHPELLHSAVQRVIFIPEVVSEKLSGESELLQSLQCQCKPYRGPEILSSPSSKGSVPQMSTGAELGSNDDVISPLPWQIRAQETLYAINLNKIQSLRSWSKSVLISIGNKYVKKKTWKDNNNQQKMLL